MFYFPALEIQFVAIALDGAVHFFNGAQQAFVAPLEAFRWRVFIASAAFATATSTAIRGTAAAAGALIFELLEGAI